MRMSWLLLVLACACGEPEPEPVALALKVRNDSARVMECRAGYVYGLVRQPEAMTGFSRTEPSGSTEFLFMVPYGDFATVAAECQAVGYPVENYYTETAHVTDPLTASIRCTAVYSEPGGLSEFNMTCDGED